MIPYKYLLALLHQVPLPLLLLAAGTFLSRFVLLTASLWVLLRVQNLNYNIPGMLGSAALASLFDMIPFVGHPAAMGVLLFCVIKLTQAHFIDVRFTVSISYAVMFLLQMLILSVMPGELRAFARSRNVDQSPIVRMTASGDESDNLETKPPSAGATNQVSKTDEPVPAPTPTPAIVPSVPKAAPAAPLENPAIRLARSFSLKGVTKNSRASLVMVNTGTRNYTIQQGESVSMETADGKVEVSVESVGETAAVLKIGGISTPLQLR